MPQLESLILSTLFIIKKTIYYYAVLVAIVLMLFVVYCVKMVIDVGTDVENGGGGTNGTDYERMFMKSLDSSMILDRNLKWGMNRVKGVSVPSTRYTFMTNMYYNENGVSSTIPFYTTNGGFDRISCASLPGLSSVSRPGFFGYNTESDLLILLTRVSDMSTVYHSHDGGLTWTNPDFNSDYPSDLGVPTWIPALETFVCIILGGISTSSDGLNFKKTSLNMYVEWVTYSPSLNVLIVGSQKEGTSYSEDGGVTWVDMSSVNMGFGIWVSKWQKFVGFERSGDVRCNVIFESTDGKVWTSTGQYAKSDIYTGDWIDAYQMLVCVGRGDGNCYSVDGGKTFVSWGFDDPSDTTQTGMTYMPYFGTIMLGNMGEGRSRLLTLDRGKVYSTY